MRKIMLILYLLCVFSLPTCAYVFNMPVKIEYVVNNTPKLKNIKCGFIQEKYMPNIKKPLVSKGDFEYIENRGVYFHTKYPIDSVSDYTNKNYKQINDVVEVMSQKKYKRLEKEFDFYYEGNIEKWVFGLKPKKASSASNFIKNITVEGRANIDKIQILQTNESKTIIWFIK